VRRLSQKLEGWAVEKGREEGATSTTVFLQDTEFTTGTLVAKSSITGKIPPKTMLPIKIDLCSYTWLKLE
jgi:hypothetical protein